MKATCYDDVDENQFSCSLADDELVRLMENEDMYGQERGHFVADDLMSNFGGFDRPP